jgi:hypothetical protein
VAIVVLLWHGHQVGLKGGKFERLVRTRVAPRHGRHRDCVSRYRGSIADLLVTPLGEERVAMSGMFDLALGLLSASVVRILHNA